MYIGRIEYMKALQIGRTSLENIVSHGCLWHTKDTTSFPETSHFFIKRKNSASLAVREVKGDFFPYNSQVSPEDTHIFPQSLLYSPGSSGMRAEYEVVVVHLEICGKGP